MQFEQTNCWKDCFCWTLIHDVLGTGQFRQYLQIQIMNIKQNILKAFYADLCDYQ